MAARGSAPQPSPAEIQQRSTSSTTSTSQPPPTRRPTQRVALCTLPPHSLRRRRWAELGRDPSLLSTARAFNAKKCSCRPAFLPCLRTHLPPPAGRRRPTFVLRSGALLVCCCPTTSSVACVPRHQEPPPKSMVTPLHSGLALGPVTLPIRRLGAVDSPAIPLWRASASSTSIASHPCSLVPALHRLEQTKKEKTLMQWFRCREISVQKREVR
ncbi:uncharacterized protein LOC119319685 [Triticum dicoccoides]|uniref:uncharacterized protein LOC119319685 n=1 Tax=Triticum dicoccoides TaxID=85692 RepID=UPI00188F294E|nr:uncharacterized protein LOC119319685 [Triticum dicoccoides]